MLFWVVCHFTPFQLSTGRQIDAGRRTRTATGRQGEGDWCSRKAVYSAWATVPLSWLGLVNQASPPGPIFHSQTFATACSPACDERGCCHRSYRSCGMSVSDRGISPIWAWSLKCPISSRCLSASYMYCLLPSHCYCRLTEFLFQSKVSRSASKKYCIAIRIMQLLCLNLVTMMERQQTAIQDVCCFWANACWDWFQTQLAQSHLLTCGKRANKHTSKISTFWIAVQYFGIFWGISKCCKNRPTPAVRFL